MQCVILAGGLGTRMARFTERMPKALIPVNGEPFLRRQLRRLAADGVSDVVIATGHLGEQIAEEVRTNAVDGLSVRCIPDGRELLGTGGCIRRLLDLGALDHRFLMTYGDSFLTLDHGAVWRAFDGARYDALMTVSAPLPGRDLPNARAAGGSVQEYRKGVRVPSGLDLVDHGLCVLTADAVRSTIPSDVVSDLADVWPAWAAAGSLQAFVTSERYYEIGSETGLAELEELLDVMEVAR